MIVVSLLIGNLRPPPALLIESIDGLTYSPSGALMSATPRFAETAKSYERYPAPPSVCEMPDATPSLPLAPVLTGQCTALSAPTLEAHSELSAESHPVHNAGVLPGDLLVVPLGDVPEEDVGDGLAVELQAAVDTLHVVGEDDGAECGGELDVVLVRQVPDLIALQRHVGCPEIHGLGRELLDPASGPDRLIVDLGVRLLLEEGLGPQLVQRLGEGRAGAVERGALETARAPAGGARTGVVAARPRHQGHGRSRDHGGSHDPV